MQITPDNIENCYGCISYATHQTPLIAKGDGTYKIGCKECHGYILREKTLIEKIIDYLFYRNK